MTLRIVVCKRSQFGGVKDLSPIGKGLKYLDPDDRIFNRIASDISVEQRETTLTISDSIETGSRVET